MYVRNINYLKYFYTILLIALYNKEILRFTGNIVSVNIYQIKYMLLLGII